jgi:CopG family nickel-responsive transcriptional regulator
MSVSLPSSLQEDLDDYVKRHGYSGRSEVIRHALAETLNKEDESTDRVVTVVHSGRHDHFEGDRSCVQMHLHSCLGTEECVELFHISGESEDLDAFLHEVKKQFSPTHIQVSGI